MPERRLLDFASLDEIMPDVERLVGGHVTGGQWTPAQILYHLATSIRLTSLGRPGSASEGVSDEFRRRFFESRRFPEGMEAPHRRLIPPDDADVRVETEALRDAIGLFARATGPFPAHPLLGPLSKEEWTEFHCIHCAHHLRFVSPVRVETEPSAG